MRTAVLTSLTSLTADPFGDERVSLLRKRAEQILDTKLVFFLFNKDDLKGSVKRCVPWLKICPDLILMPRLEEQLKPLAVTAYKEEIKRIKRVCLMWFTPP